MDHARARRIATLMAMLTRELREPLLFVDVLGLPLAEAARRLRVDVGLLGARLTVARAWVAQEEA